MAIAHVISLLPAGNGKLLALRGTRDGVAWGLTHAERGSGRSPPRRPSSRDARADGRARSERKMAVGLKPELGVRQPSGLMGLRGLLGCALPTCTPDCFVRALTGFVRASRDQNNNRSDHLAGHSL